STRALHGGRVPRAGQGGEPRRGTPGRGGAPVGDGGELSDERQASRSRGRVAPQLSSLRLRAPRAARSRVHRGRAQPRARALSAPRPLLAPPRSLRSKGQLSAAVRPRAIRGSRSYTGIRGAGETAALGPGPAPRRTMTAYLRIAPHDQLDDSPAPVSTTVPVR